MQRQLLKRNPGGKDDSDEFYRMFSGQAICAKPELERSQYCDLFAATKDETSLGRDRLPEVEDQ